MGSPVPFSFDEPFPVGSFSQRTVCNSVLWSYFFDVPLLVDIVW